MAPEGRSALHPRELKGRGQRSGDGSVRQGRIRHFPWVTSSLSVGGRGHRLRDTPVGGDELSLRCMDIVNAAAGFGGGCAKPSMSRVENSVPDSRASCCGFGRKTGKAVSFRGDTANTEISSLALPGGVLHEEAL